MEPSDAGDSQLNSVQGLPSCALKSPRLVPLLWRLQDLTQHDWGSQAVHGPLLQRALRGENMTQLPIAVRQAAFCEAADCFAGMVPSQEAARKLLNALALLWDLGTDDVERLLALNKPAVSASGTDVLIGRAVLPAFQPETAAARSLMLAGQQQVRPSSTHTPVQDPTFPSLIIL